MVLNSSADEVLMEHIITGDKGDGVPNLLSADVSFSTVKRQRPILKTVLAEW